MLGGNDALNTVVPADGVYRDARPRLALPDDELLQLEGANGLGLHASLAPLMPMWEDGNLAIATGVAFDSQTRSHFESRDVWWRAGDDPQADGWLARWIDAAAIDRPEVLMEAIALGAGPRALAGSSASAVNDPTDFGLDPPSGMSEVEFESFLLSVAQGSANDGALTTSARGALPLALSTQKILADAGDEAAGDAYSGQGSAALDVQLQTAASLITTRPGLRVVTVGIEGFDTHADQLGAHSALLADVSGALSRFWSELGPQHQKRSLVMTTTEFGRRVAENGSSGTDHGLGSVQFLLGGDVAGGQVAGEYGLSSLVDGDLPMAVPAQDLYADALRWLGGPVEDVLGVNPPATGLVRV